MKEFPKTWLHIAYLLLVTPCQLTGENHSRWPRRPIRARCPCSAPMAAVFMATHAPTVCAPCVTRSICRDRTTPESPPWLLLVRTTELSMMSLIPPLLLSILSPFQFNSLSLFFFFFSPFVHFSLQVAAVEPQWRPQPFRDWRPHSTMQRLRLRLPPPPLLLRSPTPLSECVIISVYFFKNPKYNLLVGILGRIKAIVFFFLPIAVASQQLPWRST